MSDKGPAAEKIVAMNVVVKTLRARGHSFERLGHGFLIAALLILIGGAYTLYNVQNAELAKIQESADNFEDIAGPLAESARVSEDAADRLRPLLPLLMAELRARAETAQSEKDRQDAKELLNTLETNAAIGFSRRVDSKIYQEIAEFRTDVQHGLLVQFTATKISTVILVIFLVQILTTSYRYTTRLSQFYHSRADAIEASDGSMDKLQTLIPLLSTEHVGFGKGAHGLSELIQKLTSSGGS